MASWYRRSWSFREASRSSSYTISSSSAGTLSTAYTFASDSHMSPFDAATPGVVCSEEVKDKEAGVKGLVQEYFAGSDSIDGCGDIHVLERWFMELGVGWVPRLRVGEKHDQTPPNAARLWSQAFNEINSSVTSLMFHSSINDHVETQVAQCTRFIQEAILRMCYYVEFIVAFSSIDGMPGLYEKLDALLHVHFTLSNAVPYVSYRSLVCSEIKKIQLDEMDSLLSKKGGKVRRAICTTMEEIWTRIQQLMEDEDDSWRGTQGSSGIHKVTLSLTSYIMLLYTHHRSVDQVISEAASLGNYVTSIASSSAFASLTMEMTLFFEEKLLQNSLLFSNQSLRFLFLVNNLHFVWEKLHELRDSVWGSRMEAFTNRIEKCIQNYLHVSWAPVLSCLSCTTTFFLARSTPLCKFESEFMRTYTTQKLWKVPNPTLRGRLRNAIVEGVALGYRKYCEDNNVTTPRITPQVLEQMLWDLFEG